MYRKNIPKTDSIQELADFWDTHDLTDFEDELEEVDEPVFDSLISVQLEPEEFEVIETLAKRLQQTQEISFTSLATQADKNYGVGHSVNS
ncbi:hypothetical protein F4054_00590 [Candidatus Poribacteria bacterium]|nr:hypothetical protein [Candidatus Poribacteria bacterium]MYK20743.1 hypothetical protein [Candidatus Poribacteria bacterium]